MRLTLKKETLVRLSDDELGDVAGASYRTKYDCTESYQVCDPGVTQEMCARTFQVLCLQTRLGACIPTQQGC